MFEGLSDKLQMTLKKIRGQATLTETNISDAMREIRLALLDADVHLDIVKDFIKSVKEECIGLDVLRTVSPGQQLIKIVNDHLTALMGESEVPLNLNNKKPAVIMMVGLHGSGKTTTSAKLAVNLKKQNKKPLLVAADVYRPAAIDQLKILGEEIDVPVYANTESKDVAQIAIDAIKQAKHEQNDVVIIDTAGRLQIDESMIEELVNIKKSVDADEILLIADSALGQEAVSVASSFHSALGLTGFILTKLDGDARGGAALSIRKVTGCPIKYIGVGEKTSDLEIFYPDRMASRILGMGDIVTLVEKAAEEIDQKEADRLHEKMLKNTFDFNDFQLQLQQMKKMGGMEKILNLLPGGKELATTTNLNEDRFVAMDAIISSMTKKEKLHPEIIDFRRKTRLAKGSGTDMDKVANLMKQFKLMKKMMKKTGLLNRLLSGDVDFSGIKPEQMKEKLKSGRNFTPKKKKRKKNKKKRR